MMFRAMLALALGLHTAGAFQAPGLTAGRTRTTPLKSFSPGSADHTLGSVGRQTSQPQPSHRAQQLVNRAPNQQIFGGTFSSAPTGAQSADALKQQIAAEMGKPTKDYNQLKQLKSQLQAREALEQKANVLQTELRTAEGREDYDRCQDLQSQLDQLMMSMSGANQQTSSGLATYNNNNAYPQVYNNAYNGPMSRGGYGSQVGLGGGYGYHSRLMGGYGMGMGMGYGMGMGMGYGMGMGMGFGGMWGGRYGPMGGYARRSDIAWRTRRAFHGGNGGSMDLMHGCW